MRRACVRRTPDGWVAHLVGGSVSKPFSTWAVAYDYAHRMTLLHQHYWAKPC